MVEMKEMNSYHRTKWYRLQHSNADRSLMVGVSLNDMSDMAEENFYRIWGEENNDMVICQPVSTAFDLVELPTSLFGLTA